MFGLTKLQKSLYTHPITLFQLNRFSPYRITNIPLTHFFYSQTILLAGALFLLKFTKWLSFTETSVEQPLCFFLSEFDCSDGEISK